MIKYLKNPVAWIIIVIIIILLYKKGTFETIFSKVSSLFASLSKTASATDGTITRDEKAL
jgi:hypothetical protein